MFAKQIIIYALWSLESQYKCDYITVFMLVETLYTDTKSIITCDTDAKSVVVIQALKPDVTDRSCRGQAWIIEMCVICQECIDSPSRTRYNREKLPSVVQLSNWGRIQLRSKKVWTELQKRCWGKWGEMKKICATRNSDWLLNAPGRDFDIGF